jgi:alpha-tubulin suppressor-like RCC1 family protein
MMISTKMPVVVAYFTVAFGACVSSPARAATPFPTQVSAGMDNTCATLSDGTAYCWGSNENGQIGNGLGCAIRRGLCDLAPVPVQVDDLHRAIEPLPSRVSIIDARQVTIAGDLHSIWRNHACALTADGKVSCWGHNGLGQLGIGVADDVESRCGSNLPRPISSERRYLQVACGGIDCCGLATDGSVDCWGGSFVAQTGSTLLSGVSTPAPVLGASRVRSVALGESHACVLREDRKVECWGSNSRNELGIGVAYEACFLDEGGQKLICSDGPRRTEPGHHGNRVFDAVVKGLNDVADLALGDSMSCARHEDGKVSCWGSEWGGTPRRVDGIPLVNQLAVGGRRLCGVAQDCSVPPNWTPLRG